MRSLLGIVVAICLAVLVVLCALALEPLRWCVVHVRPWWRQAPPVSRRLPRPESEAAA